MFIQIRPIRASIVAMATSIWFFARVRSFMSLQAAGVSKFPLAIFTRIRTYIVVTSHMHGQSVHLSKAFTAHFTR